MQAQLHLGLKLCLNWCTENKSRTPDFGMYISWSVNNLASENRTKLQQPEKDERKHTTCEYSGTTTKQPVKLKKGNCFERKKKIQTRHIWVVHHRACGYTGCGMLAKLQIQHLHGTYICATNNLATVNLFIRLPFGLAISHTNHVGLRYLHIFCALCYQH